MVTWGALIVGLLAFMAWAFALFRGLLAAIVTQRTHRHCSLLAVSCCISALSLVGGDPVC